MFKNSRSFKYLCSATQNLCISNKKYVTEDLIRKNAVVLQQIRGKKDDTNLSSLFVPVPIKPNPDDINVGAELTGDLNKTDLLKVVNKFYQRKEIKQLLRDNGLDSN